MGGLFSLSVHPQIYQILIDIYGMGKLFGMPERFEEFIEISIAKLLSNRTKLNSLES